jgi:large conductance mechanosensitive channel
MVDDVLMPPIGLLLGGVDFSNIFVLLKEGAKAAAPYAGLVDAKTAGAVTINFGLFFNAVISFLIVAFAIFLLIRGMNAMRRQQEAPPASPTTKECPFCFSAIAIKASRCPQCTSEVKAA